MAACDYNFKHKHTIRGANFVINVGGVEGLMQQFQLQVQRPVQVVYGIGSSDVYRVEGPPQGTLQVQKVLAPCATADLLDCSCGANDVIMTTGNDPCEGLCSPVRLVLKNVGQQAFSMGGSVSSGIISGSATYVFTHVEA